MGIGCLFSWDGAVVDSFNKHQEAWSLLAKEIGKPLPDGFFKKAFGKRNLWVIPNLLGWTEDRDEIFNLGNRKETIYREIIRNNLPALIPGLKAFIEDLIEHNIPCVVATSLMGQSYDCEAGLNNFGGYFSAIIAAERYQGEKPDPEIFLK